MAIHKIGDVVDNVSGIDFKEIEKTYHKIFDKMPEDKKLIIDQMAGPWGMWQCANDAYIYATDKNKKEHERILCVGAMSDMALQRFRNLREMLGMSVDETLEVMQNTSKWLEKVGWISMPKPYDENGVQLIKTARGLYQDMLDFSKARSELQQELKAIAEAKANKSR